MTFRRFAAPALAVTRVAVAAVILALGWPATAGAETTIDDGASPTLLARLQMDASAAMIAPIKAYAQKAPLAGGVAFRALAAFDRIPLAVGLSAHLLAVEGRDYDEGIGGLFTDAAWIIGPTRSHVQTELRMFDVVAHLEPHWTRVRPFVEGTLGIGQYFTTWTRSLLIDGSIVSKTERADDATWTSGLGVGVNIEPWRRRPIPKGRATWVFTLGVRRLHGGHISYVGPDSMSAAGQATPSRSSPNLDAVMPFIGFGFVVVPPAPEDRRPD